MISPYFLMMLLYLFVAVVAALDTSLISSDLLPWFNGVRRLRIHFITLGMLTQVIFGALPVLVATRRKLPQPSTRWDIWLTLNMMHSATAQPLGQSVKFYVTGLL